MYNLFDPCNSYNALDLMHVIHMIRKTCIIIIMHVIYVIQMIHIKCKMHI